MVVPCPYGVLLMCGHGGDAVKLRGPEELGPLATHHFRTLLLGPVIALPGRPEGHTHPAGPP